MAQAMAGVVCPTRVPTTRADLAPEGFSSLHPSLSKEVFIKHQAAGHRGAVEDSQ